MAFLTQAANRGSISTGYDIDNSCKFERDSNESIETTNQAGGNRKTWTFSAWIKRTALSEDYHTIFGAEYTNIQIMSNNRPRLVLYNGTSYYADPEMLLRDTSAWYHIVVQLDTTQSTAADRVKWWINGERVTTFNNSTYTNMTQNTDFSGIGQPSSYGSGGWLRLGRFFSGDEGFDGYMADVYYLNGTAAEADDFGEYDEDSGIWIPKAYTGGGYGTQGFHYKFDNASNLGEDSSGEGHDANSLNNISSADQAIDTPTNNFATLNLQVPNYVNTGGATEGGTKIPWAGVNSYGAFYATQGVTAGKWYWEFYIPSRSASYGLMNYVGLHTMEELILTSPYRSEAMKNNVFWLMHYGDWYAHVNGSQSSQNTVAGIASRGTEAVGRTYAIAFNADDGEMTYYENGTRISNLEFDIFDLDDRMAAGVFVVPWFQVYHNDMNVNFGGYSSIAISSGNTDGNGYGNFEYAPPSGYYALCSKNLAEFGG
jgi:hypothetical protein